MAASIAELLSTRITTGVISRVAASNKYLLGRFGFQPGGSAEVPQGHRQFGYDIFNDTRTVTQARAPGVSAATITRQKVGRVDGVFPRFYEKLPLLSEEISNYRIIGGPNSVYDERGAQYIARQQRFLGQRAGNNRMLLLMGMMRGLMYAHKTGDDVYYDFTSTNNIFEINWQMPANNKNQLNGIIGTTWADENAPIPADLRDLNASLQETTGSSLGLIVCGVDIWNAVVSNNNVQAEAGAVNQPFSLQERVAGVDANGQPQTVYIGRIAAYPQVEWVITDEGLSIGAPGSETFTKYIPANSFYWGPMPSRDYYEMLLGSEPVNEGYGRPERVAMGLTGWTKPMDDPAGFQMFSLDNCIPANYIPASNGLATAIF